MPDNEAVIHALVARINAREFDVAAESLTEDCVHHTAGLGAGLIVGREAWCGWVKSLCSAFPDRSIRVHECIAEGDRVALRLTWTGTHFGKYAGIAPTGRAVEVNGISVFSLRDGHIAEQWIEQDVLSLHQQLGAAPGRSKNWPGA
jgi:steroid delta-isomerase-like uncharacterized protein